MYITLSPVPGHVCIGVWTVFLFIYIIYIYDDSVEFRVFCSDLAMKYCGAFEYDDWRRVIIAKRDPQQLVQMRPSNSFQTLSTLFYIV